MYEREEEIVRVAAAVIKNEDEYLICQRGINRRYGMKWEFPGGKTYPGEKLTECLERELWEELNIEPVTYKELKTIQAEYDDGGRFLITFFLVTKFNGELKNRAFEDIKWVTLEKIKEFDMLQGSTPILQYLK